MLASLAWGDFRFYNTLSLPRQEQGNERVEAKIKCANLLIPYSSDVGLLDKVCCIEYNVLIVRKFANNKGDSHVDSHGKD